MSTSGPTEPFGHGAANGDPLPPRPSHDVWGHQTGEDTARLLDASGHVPRHQEPLARLVAEPHVITAADRRRATIARLATVVVLLAAVAVAVWWVLSAT